MTPAEQARQRYAAIGERWLIEHNIKLKAIRKSLSGEAYVKAREIVGPWPTTSRNRLYIIAHEIGHVVLNHHPNQIRYVKEYEAEKFAHEMLRTNGITVPRKMTERAKRYVGRMIDMHCRRAHRPTKIKAIFEWVNS